MSNKGIKGYGCSQFLFLPGGWLIFLILKELTGLRGAQVPIVFLLAFSSLWASEVSSASVKTEKKPAEIQT